MDYEEEDNVQGDSLTALYYQLFQVNQDGIKVLEDLASQFYDGDMFCENTNSTFHKVGQRSVVQYILSMCQMAESVDNSIDGTSAVEELNSMADEITNRGIEE